MSDPSASIDLALLLLEVFPGLATKLALGRLSSILAEPEDILEPAIKATAARFNEVEGTETALERWTASEAFTEFFDRAYAGERDFGSAIIQSFINEGDFYMADDAERFAVAAGIVRVFLAEMSAAIYRSDEGLLAVANRQEELHIETRSDINSHVNDRLAELEAKLPSLLATAMAKDESDSLPDPAHRALADKIDVARDLIDQGLPRAARDNLENIKRECKDIPPDLEFRLVTNLGACALAEGDNEEACALLEKAYRLQPENEKGITNASIAAHLRNDTSRAVELAHRARECDRQNSQATAVLMREFWTMGQTDQFEELVTANGWIADDEACGLLLAKVRASQFCFDKAANICRSLIQADAKGPVAHLTLSQCLLFEADAKRRLLIGDNDEALAPLSEAEEEATRAIDLLDSTQLLTQRQEALIARAGARALLGSTTQAMFDLDKILAENPAHSEAIFNKGLLLLNVDRPDDARVLLERIPHSSRSNDATFLLAEACFLSGHVGTTVELLRRDLALKCPGWKEIRMAEILSRAEAALGDDDSVGPILDEVRQRAPNDPRLLTLAAIGRDLRGDPAGSEELLLEALDHAGEADRREVLIRLGVAYQKQGRFRQAADNFALALNGLASHPAATALLVCLVNGGRLREALDWAQRIRESHRQPPKLSIAVEAQLLEYAGDIPRAVTCRKELSSRTDASTYDQVKLAVAHFRLGERDAAREIAGRISAAQLTDDPEAILQLALLKLPLGINEYLDDAYVARRFGIDDPSIHLAYIGLFHSRENQGWSEPEIAGPSCAVLLRGDSGEQWWQLLKDGEDPHSPYEIAPNHDLARQLTGRRAGETLVIRQDLEELSYEIAAIQSKYVRAYQETIEEFSTRFPGNMGLSRVKIENDDITKILYTMDQRHQLAREVERMYRQKQLPLASFASLLGRSVLEAWHACSAGEFGGIHFAFGTEEEANAANELLREVSSIVLDLPALLTVYELKLANHLHARFQHIAVPQHVIDELQEIYARTLMGPVAGSMGKGSDGRYTLTEFTEGEWSQWRMRVRAILEFAESFDRVASYSLLDADDVAQLVDVLTWAGIGAVYAGDKQSSDRLVLVSDDLGMSSVARSLGYPAVNSQAVLKELRRSEVITDEEYASWIERMVLLSYRFIRLDHHDILRRLEEANYVTTDGTRAMIGTLEGPDCSEDSAVSVTANLMLELVGRAPFRQSELILSAVLGTLIRGRMPSRVLAKFRREMESRFALVPFMRDYILDTVDTYIALH